MYLTIYHHIFCIFIAFVYLFAIGTTIRTNYMSGCVTDLGSSLGKLCRYGYSKTEIVTFKRLLPSLFAFILGAAIATWLHPKCGKYMTLISCIGFAIFGGIYGMRITLHYIILYYIKLHYIICAGFISYIPVYMFCYILYITSLWFLTFISIASCEFYLTRYMYLRIRICDMKYVLYIYRC